MNEECGIQRDGTCVSWGWSPFGVRSIIFGDSRTVKESKRHVFGAHVTLASKTLLKFNNVIDSTG
jgi:hypothetical protein